MFKAVILLDSINQGNRLTTFELTYPRFIHSEFMTHRLFSRNSSSSRAIPVAKMLERIEENPAIPIHWGKNQKGMAAEEEFEGAEKAALIEEWLMARDKAVESARAMLKVGVHKQVVNRILEPYSWITVLCTATCFENFFYFRCDPQAQPEIKLLAELMRDAYQASMPKEVGAGNWHMPLLQPEDVVATVGPNMLEVLQKVCTARCARVSYLTHDGRRDLQADLDLYERLYTSKHMSPFEHLATPADPNTMYGNFKGWKQFRKIVEASESFVSCR